METDEKNTYTDVELNLFIKKVNHFISNPEEGTKETIELIKELRDKLNRLWMKIEQQHNLPRF